MHLAIVTPYPPRLTGIGQYGYHLSTALARSGVFDRVTILTERGSRSVSLPREDTAAVSVEGVWEMGQLSAARRIVTRLRQIRPQLVWYNLGSSLFGQSPLANLLGLLSPAATRLSGFSTIVTLHEIVEQADLRSLAVPGGRLASWGARWITYAGSRADVVCVTMRRQADWLQGRWPELKVIHIPHGSYDRPEFLPASPGNELLLFNSLAPHRGFELMLDAFKRLRSRDARLGLTIAGAEHPRFPGYLECLKRTHADLPGVTWLGCVPEADLPELFGRSQVVVLPYTATTGSSSVLFRAATWGRPVVCSDLPELRASVGEAGLTADFFRSGDPDSLVEVLGRVLADPERRARLSRQNLRTMEQMTVEETCQAYLRAFQMALTGRKETSAAASMRRGEELAS